ncbi:SCO family protein [Polaromonas sp.]|uniref:SCO family protein n=1 Tax=Polaromonas sp. TaxID=1869339 RepID=UPI003BAC945D
MSHQPTRRFTLLAGLASAALSLAGCNKPASPVFQGMDLTDHAYVKDFRLTDTDGRERTLADFKGKLVMLFFGFTQCPDVCPTALARAVAIKGLLGVDGERLQVLFVTVDPERDSAAVLKAYMQVFDPGFIGLYGTLQQTRETANAFKVHYKKVPTGASYTMDHSTFSYVFDFSGNLRLALRHNQSAEECAGDLRQLVAST